MLEMPNVITSNQNAVVRAASPRVHVASCAPAFAAPTVVFFGIAISSAPGADAPSEGEIVRVINVYATYYTPASAGRPPSDPNYGRTATGVLVTYGIVAVDPTVIPLGTRMFIPGYGYAVAADTGGAVKGYIIDLGYPDGVAVDWRSRWLDIYILS